MKRFKNRTEAGREMGRRLQEMALENPLIVALPRGGVPVALEMAKTLNAPVDIAVVRKVGAPGNPEFGVGAVAEDGVTLFHHEVLEALGLSEEDLAPAVSAQMAEVERRVKTFRGERKPIPVSGRTVILVDDGLATGVSATAAARLLRHRGAGRVILAAPVCAPDTARAMARDEVDDVVCLRMPEALMSIGAWYDDFSQLSDEEVVRLLALAETRTASPAAP